MRCLVLEHPLRELGRSAVLRSAREVPGVQAPVVLRAELALRESRKMGADKPVLQLRVPLGAGSRPSPPLVFAHHGLLQVRRLSLRQRVRRQVAKVEQQDAEALRARQGSLWIGLDSVAEVDVVSFGEPLLDATVLGIIHTVRSHLSGPRH